MQVTLERFKACYRYFGCSSLAMLPELYHIDAVFKDPVHEVRGLAAINAYFDDMSQNLIACKFDYTHELVKGNQAFLQWRMHYQHPALGGGKEITIAGMTRLAIENGLIVDHEDCYDMGAMVYEHVPVVGLVVRWLRRRLAVTHEPLQRLDSDQPKPRVTQ